MDHKEIHFDCPKCQRPMTGDTALLTEIITCPDCGEQFMPQSRRIEPPKAAMLNSEELAARDELEQRMESKLRIKAIRGNAKFLGFLAILFSIIGLAVCFLSGFYADASSRPGGFVLGACCFGTALWLYLISQVVHIRANTEK